MREDPSRGRNDANVSQLPSESPGSRRPRRSWGSRPPAAWCTLPRSPRRSATSMTPDEIIALMKKGNERFRLGQESPHDYLAQQKATAKGQYPAAVILSCIDSRAPAETIMDLGIGDCFNARVAGNVANDDILGSMEFACKLAGAKVVLVMGHTACGAIKGAIDNVAARKSHGLARQDPPRRGGNPVSGRALGQELRLCGRGGAQECRADHGGHPPAQCGPGRAGSLAGRQDRRSDVQRSKRGWSNSSADAEPAH